MNLWMAIFFLFFSSSTLFTLSADPQPHAFTLTSPSFKQGGWILKKHACKRLGGNQSPKLEWKNPPSGTKSFALICSDPDVLGGIFIHWIIYNIPEQTHHLDEGISHKEQLSDGSKQGINSFNHLGYDGPCPPSEEPHHYVFTLYALDNFLNLDPDVTYDPFMAAMTGHILGKAEFSGLFQNQDIAIKTMSNPHPRMPEKTPNSG